MTPQWSPADERILYLWDRGGGNGSLVPQIITLRGEVQELGDELIISGGPTRWSPNGRWIILFGSSRDGVEHYQTDPWLLDTMAEPNDESVLKRITYDEEPAIGDGLSGLDEARAASEAFPQWSPDGNQFAYFRGQDFWVLSLLDGNRHGLPSLSHEVGVDFLVGP